PDSEAHDLVMSLFGGLSKAERRRIQIRTRASVLALAADGRWLGGRPNYGYRLIDTGLPHPNRSKAAAGAQLRTLEPDPDAAPVVGEELGQRVNTRITTPRSNRTRRPRSQPGQYLFAGVIRCGHCGKAMFGATGKNKPYYRCTATRPDYATPSVPGHPPTYSV